MARPKRSVRSTPSPPDARTIRRAVRAYAVRAKDAGALAAELGVSAARFRRWRAQLEPELGWSLEDWVMTSLFHASKRVDGIIAWVDWKNHVVYSSDEVEGALRALAARGLAREKTPGVWEPSRESDWA